MRVDVDVCRGVRDRAAAAANGDGVGSLVEAREGREGAAALAVLPSEVFVPKSDDAMVVVYKFLALLLLTPSLKPESESESAAK